MHNLILLLATTLSYINVCTSRITFSLEDNIPSDESLRTKLYESSRGAITANYLKNDHKIKEVSDANERKRKKHERKEDREFWKDVWTTDDFHSKVKSATNTKKLNSEKKQTVKNDNKLNVEHSKNIDNKMKTTKRIQEKIRLNKDSKHRREQEQDQKKILNINNNK